MHKDIFASVSFVWADVSMERQIEFAKGESAKKEPPLDTLCDTKYDLQDYMVVYVTMVSFWMTLPMNK